ncbi:MAG: hypothetical protein Q7T38_04095 [Gallionella sp.]|nr:hypothetical protein [Gallionella sp.]
MKNVVIALRGAANQGKSSSIKQAFSLLKQKLSIDSISHEITGADIRAVLTIGNIKIGIESQGDPNSRLTESLKLFTSLGCQIIICATRTRGATVKAVQDLNPSYTITFINKVGEKEVSKQAAVNLATANQIVTLVQNALP